MKIPIRSSFTKEAVPPTILCQLERRTLRCWMLVVMLMTLIQAPSVASAWIGPATTSTRTAGGRSQAAPPPQARTEPSSCLSSSIMPKSQTCRHIASVTDQERHPQVAAVWDRETLLQYAEDHGVQLSLTTLGPGYRAIARSTQNTTQILGYVEGFVRGNLLHMDKMEVFRPMVKLVRKSNPQFTGGANPLGVGLLMAHLCVLHGQDQKCTVAEFLAIDDAEHQHQRLVKLYRQAGFYVVKYVGDDWTDIPDRLVWGGCGTLLRKDIPYLLQFWSGLLEKGKRKKQQQPQ